MPAPDACLDGREAPVDFLPAQNPGAPARLSGEDLQLLQPKLQVMRFDGSGLRGSGGLLTSPWRNLTGPRDRI
jgi:hypothetical protein